MDDGRLSSSCMDRSLSLSLSFKAAEHTRISGLEDLIRECNMTAKGGVIDRSIKSMHGVTAFDIPPPHVFRSG